MVIWYFILRINELLNTEQRGKKRTFASLTKEAIALIVIFLALNPGDLIRPFSAVRSLVGNYLVYQSASANSGEEINYLLGLEFHLGLILISIPFLIVPAIFFLIRSKLRAQTLLIIPILLLVAVFSAQSQFLGRNLLVVIPFAILLGMLGLHELQESDKRCLKLLSMTFVTFVGLQSLHSINDTLWNRKIDPRIVLSEKLGGSFSSLVGISDSCTNLGLRTNVDTVVDPELQLRLNEYVLLTSGQGRVRGLDDPISWTKPVYWGLEFSRHPDKTIVGGYLNAYTLPSLPGNYQYQIIRGNHFSIVVLNR